MCDKGIIFLYFKDLFIVILWAWYSACIYMYELYARLIVERPGNSAEDP